MPQVKNPLLRQTTLFVHGGHMKKMTALAQARGLKASQLVRLAIAEYIHRNQQ